MGATHDTTQTRARLEDAVRAGGDAQLERLREWVHLESPTGDPGSVTAVVDALVDAWAPLGGAATRHDSTAGPHLVVDLPGEARVDAGAGDAPSPVLLVAHSDTVWPVGTLGGRVPWSIDGDRLAGPGVFDMKGGLAALDGALRALDVLGLPRVPVRVVVTADEEVGSPTAREVLQTAAQGCRGALGLEPPHPDGALKVGRFGSTRLRLEAQGRAAHAALDLASGVSAVEELVDQLVAVRGVVGRALAAAPGAVLYNPGTIGGGGRTNVVADHAWADLGLRFADGATEDTVLAELAALAPGREGATLAWRTLASRPAWQASPADHAWHAALVARGARTGVAVPEARLALGAADTNVLGRAGVPSIDGLGPRGGGAHAEHEHVRLSSLAERTLLLAALLAA